jgi:hypothetical protein
MILASLSFLKIKNVKEKTDEYCDCDQLPCDASGRQSHDYEPQGGGDVREGAQGCVESYT